MYEFRTNYASSIKNHFDNLIDEHAYRYLDVCPEIKAFARFDESTKSGTDAYYIGMIWVEGGSKLDLTELMLRGSQSLTDNAKVTLDLSGVSQEFSFFPGQIIAFSARPNCERNRRLVVTRLVDPIKIMKPFPDIEFTPMQARRFIAASGPFTTYNDSGDVEYKALSSFLDHCKQFEPSDIILIGPFTDSENKKGLLKSPRDSYDEFNSLVSRIRSDLSELVCNVYLVSSPRELMCESMNSANIYPCPKLSFKISTKDKKKDNLNIISTSDPSHLNLDGILVSVTSIDVLFHLCSSEISMNRRTGGRMNMISSHLLNQANFYPVYPPRPGTSIDYSVLSKFFKFERSPHILITPSKVQGFIEQVNGCLVINPQRPPTGPLRKFVQIGLEPQKTYNGSLAGDLKASVINLTEAKVEPPLETQKSGELEIETKSSFNGVEAGSV